MTQDEKRSFLINELIKENHKYYNMDIPFDKENQKQLLRSLMNIRPPKIVSDKFIQIQNEYLREEIKQAGITDFNGLIAEQQQLYLWKGDITTLRIDAIVNAANSQMLGCFVPCHACIDNAIHTFAGVQLRIACADIMSEQGNQEKIGKAKITPAYNLPSKYVLHTVGPVIYGQLTKQDCELLASCYRSCLELAENNGVKSIAFCCISTGEFHFPNKRAAEIAIQTVKKYIYETQSSINVLFNVFKESDYEIYKGLLK